MIHLTIIPLSKTTFKNLFLQRVSHKSFFFIFILIPFSRKLLVGVCKNICPLMAREEICPYADWTSQQMWLDQRVDSISATSQIGLGGIFSTWCSICSYIWELRQSVFSGASSVSVFTLKTASPQSNEPCTHPRNS